MHDSPLVLLAKLDAGNALRLSAEEMRVAAEYLGLDLRSHETEMWEDMIRSELRKQNRYLSENLLSAKLLSAIDTSLSNYVRDSFARTQSPRTAFLENESTIGLASVNDVERALILVCDMLEHSLQVANASRDEKVIKFVAELAAGVFHQVQIKFKEISHHSSNEK